MSTSRTANRIGIAKPGISEHATLEAREIQVQRSGRACLSDKALGGSGRRTAGEAVAKRNNSRSQANEAALVQLTSRMLTVTGYAEDLQVLVELNNIEQR